MSNGDEMYNIEEIYQHVELKSNLIYTLKNW